MSQPKPFDLYKTLGHEQSMPVADSGTRRNSVDVWIIPTDVCMPKKLFASEAEKERSAKLSFEPFRTQFLLRRHVIRRVLSNYVDIRPDEIRFSFSRYGKPHLDHACSPKFSVSHTNALSVCAVSYSCALGIDCEAVESIEELDLLSSTCCHELEQQILLAREGIEKLKFFYKLWTGKEAILKLRGAGLIENMKSVNTLDHVEDESEFQDVIFATDDFVASLACDKAAVELHWRLFEY